ncbi:hypothetical protein KKD70_01155 [Patescibacteria group bacterium]|nr:hypothetical protein [Patescibacteria group bacterium]
MDLSVLVAKIYGTVAIALGLGMLFNAEYYKETFRSIFKDKTYLFFGGIAALVIGLLIILHHNIWEASWAVLITIIGWIALIKGFLLLVFPQMTVIFEPLFTKKTFIVITGLILFLFGLLLCYLVGCA